MQHTEEGRGPTSTNFRHREIDHQTKWGLAKFWRFRGGVHASISDDDLSFVKEITTAIPV
jgi:hypothetical protein